jgi:UDP-3-O-[3-hydroxymyristoyl] glucosamine N-acyltransferase
MKFLTDRIKKFDGEASKHRLNRNAPNPGLLSAAKAKERLSIAKKVNRQEGVDISVQLWIYPHSKIGIASGIAKKVCIFGTIGGNLSVQDAKRAR